MSIRIVCPTCGKALNAPDHAAGKQVRCPQCQGIISIPIPETELDEVDDVVLAPSATPSVGAGGDASNDDDLLNILDIAREDGKKSGIEVGVQFFKDFFGRRRKFGHVFRKSNGAYAKFRDPADTNGELCGIPDEIERIAREYSRAGTSINANVRDELLEEIDRAGHPEGVGGSGAFLACFIPFVLILLLCLFLVVGLLLWGFEEGPILLLMLSIFGSMLFGGMSVWTLGRSIRGKYFRKMSDLGNVVNNLVEQPATARPVGSHERRRPRLDTGTSEKSDSGAYAPGKKWVKWGGEFFLAWGILGVVGAIILRQLVDNPNFSQLFEYLPKPSFGWVCFGFMVDLALGIFLLLNCAKREKSNLILKIAAGHTTLVTLTWVIRKFSFTSVLVDYLLIFIYALGAWKNREAWINNLKEPAETIPEEKESRFLDWNTVMITTGVGSVALDLLVAPVAGVLFFLAGVGFMTYRILKGKM